MAAAITEELEAFDTDEPASTEEKVLARRERFREAVAGIAKKAQTGDLLRMLVLPGAVMLLGGFLAMFLGWFGASRSFREVEQLPYLISGGLFGLGLVFVGSLLLSSVLWMRMLGTFREQAEEHTARQLEALETRLLEEIEQTATPAKRSSGSGSKGKTRSGSGRGRSKSSSKRSSKAKTKS